MENINFLIVFIEGVLSIFSPCILPILPIYLSMLSNSSIDEMKNSKFKNGVLIKNTIFFTLGISMTFFILGSSLSFLSSFFSTNKNIIMVLGGIIILFMGLFYLGIIKIDFLNREKRFNVEYKNMSSWSAFVLGFTFSFGWTPCIGPILASVIVMASSSNNMVTSNLLILVYTVGFVMPFILLSLFYSRLFKRFDSIKKHMKEIKRLSGIIILISGLIMVINGFVNINSQSMVNKDEIIQGSESITDVEKPQIDLKETPEEELLDGAIKNSDEEEKKKISPIDFTLYDQFGNEHTLSEYKGKTIFVNFWATWCPPCRKEMPHIQELYEEYNENQDDVVILGVASPKLGREGTEEDIKEYLDDEGFTFPTVFDEKGPLVNGYGISAFPSTFIIDKEGYITKYIPGAMSKDIMKSLIEGER